MNKLNSLVMALVMPLVTALTNRDSKLVRFIMAHKWACAGLALSLIAAVFITFTYLAEAVYFDDPRHQNVDLRAWMTPQYIAHSYDLPRPLVMEILEINPEEHFPKRMDRLADKLGLSLEELTTRVRAAAETYRETDSD